MSKKKKVETAIIIIAALLLIFIVAYDAVSQFRATDKTEKSGVAMGSVVSVTLYGTKDDSNADEIISRIQDIDNNYISRYISSSEIYKLNSDESSSLSDFTADALKKSINISEKSDGAFDMTIGKLSALWDFDDDAQIVPSENDIKEALQTVDYRKTTMENNKFTIGENQEIDMGAVGKGIACDAGAEILKNSDITGAVVSCGGTILTYGDNPDGKTWTIGIRTPETDNTSFFATLEISGTSFISTSGSYEKCFTKDNVLYHHILSPKTGYPAETDIKSVTVISPSGLYSDALSTACFVMGYEKSLGLLSDFNAQAVFVTNDNKVYMTDSVKLKITDSNYTYGK